MGKREEWEAYAIEIAEELTSSVDRFYVIHRTALRLCFVLTLLVGIAWGFFIGVLVLR